MLYPRSQLMNYISVAASVCGAPRRAAPFQRDQVKIVDCTAQFPFRTLHLFPPTHPS